MSAAKVPGDAAITGETPSRSQLRVPHAGWRVIAAKELGDHLLSVRFIVLLVVLGLAAAIPLYFAADRIRSLAPQVSGVPAIFLALFTVGSANIGILRVDAFVGMVAPLLGLAFAFDAVNGERSEGTLPRLLAQPIYRDVTSRRPSASTRRRSSRSPRCSPWTRVCCWSGRRSWRSWRSPSPASWGRMSRSCARRCAPEWRRSSRGRAWGRHPSRTTTPMISSP